MRASPDPELVAAGTLPGFHGTMRLRDLAHRIVTTPDLDVKLAPPAAVLVDDAPGEALRIDAPERPPSLAIRPGGDVRVPKPAGMADPAQRVRILHALANHELQAVELFAWAVLAFPDAPAAFRRGCVAILADEQRHCRLYLDRLAALGAAFGDLPVSGRFWREIERVTTPLEFVCTMGLTHESANLDFAQDLRAAALAAGDLETARVIAEVHDDEVRHVAFGWRWMRAFKDPAAADWDTFVAAGPLHAPERARGARFDREAREAAGIDPDFVERLERTRPTGPGGGRR